IGQSQRETKPKGGRWDNSNLIPIKRAERSHWAPHGSERRDIIGDNSRDIKFEKPLTSYSLLIDNPQFTTIYFATFMRKYEGTHPWIKFQVDLNHAPVSLWLNLGEAQSKCEHISNEPLRPSLAKELHQLYVAKGVLATTAIEG